VQNYLDGTGLPTLVEHVTTTYAPLVTASQVELFVARQWCERAPDVEGCLSETPGVTGLVFGSFRHDNPEASKRNDWRAGKTRV
jgi:hypothetical protein